MEKYICIHGHFYQPPRENPWLEAVELQDSAYPYHDWNERVTEECYAPNTASRILDGENRILDIVNIYARISFNFGPTLLSWLESHKPEVYGAIVEADRMSRERFSGHGSAMAQVYNHMIMPLASRRDKVTQVRWGLEDFRSRFGRDPEGMWLPETAVDTESLEVLAQEGIAFTVLAPRQARRVRRAGSTGWTDVSGGRIDPTRPYLCRLPSGRSIALFFYDGPVSQDVAFDGLLNDGATFARRLMGVFPPERQEPALVHIATDGETYGHHHRGGDMALAFCLHHIENSGSVSLTNYGEHLALHPPVHEVEIHENSSWSCVHGVERWRTDCGCNSGGHPGWSQSWREPLRQAVNWLGEKLTTFYDREAAGLLKDPNLACEGYVKVLHRRDREVLEDFLSTHQVRDLPAPDKARALKLLEMRKNSLLIFTSCGWFFDEISGIETVQIMQYAAQAMQFAEELGSEPLEPEFLKFLGAATSNVLSNGATVYERHVRPARVDHLRVGAHYSISSIFEDYGEDTSIYCYSFQSINARRIEAGRVRLVAGRVRTVSDRTWDEKDLTYAVLHLGDQNIIGGVREFSDEDMLVAMQSDLFRALEKGDVMEAVRFIDRHFEDHTYSAWHLFRDEQRRVLNEVLSLTYEGIETSYRQVYENHHALMNFLQNMNVPLPHPLLVAAEYVLDRDLHNNLLPGNLSLEGLERTVGDIRRWQIKVDVPMVKYHGGLQLNSLMEAMHHNVMEHTLMEQVRSLIVLLQQVEVEPELWKAQNIYFSILKKIFPKMQGRANDGDKSAQKWVELFLALGPHLRVRVD